MIKGVFGESSVGFFVSIYLVVFFDFVIWVFGMRNNYDDHKQQQGGGGGVGKRSGRANGIIPGSFRALSSYLRVVSSGASTVASTVRSAASAASSIVDRDSDSSHDQVYWAGFDKLECEGGVSRRVLLLGYRSGFQVWDVEDADNVRDLVSKHDGPVSFIQMLPKPLTSNPSGDKFADARPLLVICAGGCPSGGDNIQDGSAAPCNGSTANFQDTCSAGFVPTTVRFYSLRSQSYVHVLKFRSVIYSVRCSSRVVAISQAAQIHCFDASTLERDYTILTNPIISASPGYGGVGYGPLAVGPRWLAYSGSPVAVSNSGRVCPQHVTPSASFPSNGSLVAHYAKESSKQLAAGIVTLGDIGYKKLSRYCSELNSLHSGSPGWKSNGTVNGHLTDADNVGMVIVRDIVSKSVISQFRAHKSPISALCFDPSGTLLVTASIQGHNINVFQIKHGLSESSCESDAGLSYAHLYRLQRGLTNAVIQDISFSVDSHWMMISSSRGTSHLFAIPPSGGSVDFQSADGNVTAMSNGLDLVTNSAVRCPPKSGVQMLNQQSICASGSPVTISAVSRIKNGNNGWRGAAAAATGRTTSLSGAIASSFHNCKGNSLCADTGSSKAKHRLLVFSPSGYMIQYALRIMTGIDSVTIVPRLSTESAPESDGRLVVEAIQKWNICQKQNRREREENIDIYGENGISDSNKIYREGSKKGNSIYPEDRAAFTKAKISPEEKHHLFISEAELQMHQAQVPAWVRPQIYFHSMMIDGVKTDEEYSPGGEMEIERIPTRMIEARSKSLVPVCDYIQTSQVQQTRVRALASNSIGTLRRQRSGMSENDRLPFCSSSGSFDSMTDGAAELPQPCNPVEETGWDGLQTPTETTKGDVNNNNNPEAKIQLENVNNRDIKENETQHNFVNNHIEGLKTKNQFEDEGDEFD